MDEQGLTSPYIPSPVDHVLQDMERSVVVFGAKGSGKRVALECMAARSQDMALLVTWTPSLVDARLLPTPQVAVFASIRTAIVQGAVDLVRSQPQLLSDLSSVSQECMRWLLEKSFSNRRLRTLSGIIPELGSLLSSPYTDLYPDYDPDSVRCQIDEMILLANELGRRKIIVVLYAEDSLTLHARKLIALLFGWRDLWQQSDLLLKAALPETLVRDEDLLSHARGRMVFLRLSWSLEQCMAVARLWTLNTGLPRVESLTDLADRALLDEIAGIIDDIRSEPLPADWKQISELLCRLHASRGRILCPALDGIELRRHLYHSLAPLQMEPDQTTVRRGRHSICLRDQQLRVLGVLWRMRSGDTRAALLQLAGSIGNLHKQISELRREIEPYPHARGEWVYICNAGDGNYVLEGVIGEAPVRTR